ncbi:receptor-like protein 33 [Quercus lobata]|uniref:Leucine-rich repeat-containing N-terminal plant-type domain-containing protein n=1 Tax=Quercus lobata TaxID=97700 RepID=A0A7N2L9V9_QUELO|nr:receptor-like protein 33 [Quercus lobata]
MFSMGKMNDQYLPLFLASCFFFISHSQTSSNTSSQHHCLPDQSAHLLQLRQEFVEKRMYSDYYNDSYPKMKSWKADSDCCSWDGVTCDTQNGEVIGLDLSNSWLYGPLNSNSSLFSLRHLRKLNLDSNNFSSSSTIPSEFGQLVRLTYLNLSYSFLHGRIPSEISWLSNLVSLDLSNNYFEYFVGGDFYYKLLDLRRIHLEALVQNMTYLRELHLGKVNISSSLPQSLANLSSLTSLTLFDCNLQGKFPSNIFLLPKIQAIDLSHNYELIGFLPKFLYRSSLKKLHLRATNFSGEFPNSMVNLGSLNVLDLSETNLFGELPNSIGNLKSLNYLDLDSNNFSGAIPPSIGNLSQLTHLCLSYNNFHGQLPSTFGNLAKLSSLELDNILFNQEVPSFLRNLTQLEQLSLSNNKFGGIFPIWLTNITKLSFIYLSRNQLKGPIPSEISRLPNLFALRLSQNSLTEAIPSNLFTIPSLSILVLDQNQLTGPLKFQNISSSPLSELILSENKLNASIPRSIANFTKLQVLHLSSTNLKGKVDLNIFLELKELRELRLSGNKVFVSKANINSTLPKFSDLRLSSCNLPEFPDFLKAQNELRILDLSNNNIKGKIPNWFWNVGKETLIFLNLSFNLLSEFEQPPLVLPWKNMQTLDLSSNMLQESFPILPLSTIYFFASKNNLTGGIPPMICKVRALQILDVSNNQLIGQIPQCLLNLSKSLEVLVMRNNHFQGNLPEMFINGCSLKTLDLNHNQIQGQIPRSLVECQMLDDLNLGNNKLNDTFPFWLVSLPELKILVLRANGFYGPIWDPHINFSLSKLHVIDLSHNNFSGKLPSEYFQNWSAILQFTGKDKSQPRYMGGDSSYYKDSVTIVSKGQEMELVKILTIFTAIDLSNNSFYGEIPNSVGNLKALIVLNLSGNNFTSHIPSSLGNLSELESLDLSRNNLFGEIPQQLTSLTFLEYLNLSQNQLTGPIPQGGQFLTFQGSSFEGNSGLCGFQLSKKCGNNEIPPTSKMKHESSLGEGFGWKVVVIGYACGLVIGLLTGHVVTSRRMDWIVRNFGVNLRR